VIEILEYDLQDHVIVFFNMLRYGSHVVLDDRKTQQDQDDHSHHQTRRVRLGFVIGEDGVLEEVPEATPQADDDVQQDVVRAHHIQQETDHPHWRAFET